MKKILIIAVAVFSLQACAGDGDNNNNANNDTALKDPATVQPPSEAITDSTKLVNGNIVPDTTPGNGPQVDRASDSIQKKQ